ncbi:MAG TPA: phage integrase N-terminal SAM-like domain-containing protein, partial [Tepidisphaeraceae bacterium]|nr:phage integrase N-terminal SAM-like domain-containing protein [Tepidisphaeraceae bacterium]
MKLHQQFVRVAARERLAGNTVDVYWMWVDRFLRFHKRGDDWRHPRELRGGEIGVFLTHLAAEQKLSASSQNQAMGKTKVTHVESE